VEEHENIHPLGISKIFSASLVWNQYPQELELNVLNARQKKQVQHNNRM